MEDNDKAGSSQEVVRTDDIKIDLDITFSKFLLSDHVLSALSSAGFKKPSPIQLKGVPLARCGLGKSVLCQNHSINNSGNFLDMILQAKSGTGKTLLFSIVLLEQFDVDLKFPQGLIIVPTREIAVQIVSVLQNLGKSIKRKSNDFVFKDLPLRLARTS